MEEEINIMPQCCICLDQYTDPCNVIYLKCGHEFHQMCIGEWLERTPHCPQCRTIIDTTNIINKQPPIINNRCSLLKCFECCMDVNCIVGIWGIFMALLVMGVFIWIIFKYKNITSNV